MPENDGWDGVWLLGVSLAALPPDRQRAARLGERAAAALMAELAEAFVGTEGLVFADEDRTEILLTSPFAPHEVTGFLCQRYFDHVVPGVPTTHPLGLRYQLEGEQAVLRLLQTAAGTFNPDRRGELEAPSPMASTPAARAPESVLRRPLEAAARVAERMRKTRVVLTLARETEPDAAEPAAALETELPIDPTLARIADTIIEDELLRLQRELEGLTPAAGPPAASLPWPEALQLTNRPHLPEEGVANLEEVFEVARWSARGLLHDCAQHLGLGPLVPTRPSR